ncbi:MAG: hypothetical protein MZV70_29150 [Desulfobacterales bacterium]|nr:hypothetical protein [Desulfobacterales bacterium]
MMDLAEALKALPKQHDMQQTLSQKSSAELLQEASRTKRRQKRPMMWTLSSAC